MGMGNGPLRRRSQGAVLAGTRVRQPPAEADKILTLAI